MAGLAQINIRFAANLREFSTQMQSVQREFQKVGTQMQNIGKTMSVAVSLPLAAMGTAAYNMAADFEDALGATDQIFKQASSEVKAWADGLLTYFGIAKKEALEYSNMMGSMLKNIGGLTEEQATKQSATLIELAGDLTAMYGGTTADAVRALTGALKGNNSMLDNYGMAVNEATVKQRAFEMGLIKQGGQMSLSAKQAATLSLIYEQTGDAQGQAAREADGASGSMRTLKTELTNLTTELGQHLLPIITPFVQKLAEIMERFRGLDPEVKKIIVVVGGLLAAAGPLIGLFGTFAAMLPTIISGVGMIGTAFTVLTGPIGLVIAAVGALLVLLVKNWSSVKKSLVDTANYFIDLYNESMLVRSAVESVVLTFKNLGAIISLVFNAAGSILNVFWQNLKTLVSGIGSFIKAILTGDLSSIPGIITEAFGKSMATAKVGLNDLKSDFKKFGNDVSKNVGDAMHNTLTRRYKMIDVDTGEMTDKVEKEVKKSVVDGINGGVDETNKKGKKVKVAVEPLQGSVGFYDKLISQMETAQKNTSTDSATYQVFQQKIDEYKKLRDEIAVAMQAEGSDQWYQERLNKMDEELKKLPLMSAEYSKLKTARDEFAKGWETVQQSLILEPEQGTVDWYNYHINELKRAQQEAGITVEEFKRLSNEINVLETTFKMEVDTEQVKEEINNLASLADTVKSSLENAFGSLADSMVNSLGEAQNGLQRFARGMFQTVMKLIAMALSSSLANAIQGATQSATATGPGAVFATPAFIATAVGGVMSAFASIPKFAAGGIVSGPTFGLMGEYAGAANNPEVIAPLDKLKKLIQPAASNDQPINLVLSGGFDISGETLKLVLDRTERRKFRTG